MARKRKPAAAGLSELRSRTFFNTISPSMSPGVNREGESASAQSTDGVARRSIEGPTRTGFMAVAAFFLVFMMFKPTTPTPPTQYYTGCELRGAIERCAEFAAEITKWSNVPLPILTGEPSREDQIKALNEQDEWLRDAYYAETARKSSTELDKWTRQNYARRGVKD
ncbi:hypothetical protein [Bradyrhizobium sp. 76]|uniref:hypothetical protein n=1 Tax=Bradyrhizobium sp. 76 TaxID=2782680 RepID=UPI001FF92659|nr:hypothetical protein [Bradyrhizobium sp. 76]MCK1404162.1 hypothetical protein [Bradyrhizobium sp. 76]